MSYEKNAAGCRVIVFLAMYCMNPKHLYPILRSNRNAVSMQCGLLRHPMPIPLLNGDAMIGLRWIAYGVKWFLARQGIGEMVPNKG